MSKFIGSRRVGTYVGIASVGIAWLCGLAAPAMADPPALTPAAHPLAAPDRYSVTTTEIGALLDDPRARLVLDRHVPGMTSDPQIDMGRPMTLRAVQQYAPDKFSDATLARIDADLARIPVSH